MHTTCRGRTTTLANAAYFDGMFVAFRARMKFLARVALPVLASVLGLGSLGCEAGAAPTSSSGGAGGTAAQGFTENTNSNSGTMSGFGGEGGASACANHCSADLHSYVDCDGNVLSTCPDGTACAPGGDCIAPCDAAAQNQSTIGCDFYSVTTPVVFGARGGCFAAMVANTWTTPIEIGLEYAGETTDGAPFTYKPVNGGYEPLTGGVLEPGDLGVIFLSQYNSGDPLRVACPKASWKNTSTQVTGAGVGSAFKITTTAPIVAYDVYPWGGADSYATSATLLLPTPSWGTNFVTADAWEAASGNPFLQIVASADDTIVTFVPKASIPASGIVPAMPAGQPATLALMKGDFLQLEQPARLAGSLLSSDKPVSVWGGSSCMNIPVGMDACDAAHQQLLPVQALGNEYVVARYPSRGGDDSAPVTLVGMVDGTTLTYASAPAGAPASIGKGDVITFNATGPFVVESQSKDFPFYVAAHMTGGATNSEGLGDPEYVNVVTPDQYLSHYLFVTDPTYNHTALVFTRKPDAAGNFHDVVLDCVGPLTGWEKVGDAEVLRLMIVDGGVGVNGCGNGVHAASSAKPFGLTVWGYDYYASYAYPAGMSVAPINDVVVPPVPQ